jgi:hypothetical protein
VHGRTSHTPRCLTQRLNCSAQSGIMRLRNRERLYRRMYATASPTLPLSLIARGYRRDAKQGQEDWLDGARFRYQHARRANGRDVAERRRVRHTLPAHCAGAHSAAPGCESGTPRESCRILHIGASCSIFYETDHLMCFISSPAPSRALRLAYPYVPPYMLTRAKQILSPLIAYRRDRAVVYLGRLLHEPILVLR